MTAPVVGRDEIRRVLRERALVLSALPPGGPNAATLEVLVARVGDERCAIELADVRSVQRSVGLIPVPCTSAQVAGVLNVRGQLVAVLDLATMLGLAPLPAGPETLVLLVDVGHGPVGILVDGVLGVQRLEVDVLDQPLTGITYTRGVADGATVVLDLRRLLAEQSFGDGASGGDWR
jgi:purine-binding chemotaxis protein CheW